MKYFEPSVVIVDDKKEEIEGLIDHYHTQGIGCKYFNADLHDGDSYPDKPMSDVMLLFLDLYYSDAPLENGYDPELSASWVRSIIHPGAFYILILWTKDPAQAKLVTDKLDELNRHPFQTFIEGKNTYAIDSPEKYNYEELFKSIDAKIAETPEIEEILIWKNTIKKASNVVLGGLISTDTEEFSNKLKKITVCHGGKIISGTDDFSKKRASLFAALNNVLVSNAPQYNFEEEISVHNQTHLYDLSQIDSPVIDNQLNSWFHFNLTNNLNKLTCPGIIAKNNSAFLKNIYSIKNDSFVHDYISPQTEQGVLIEDVVLNIIRPCDYAQNKYGKNLKLLGGIAVIHPKRKDGDKKDIKLKQKHDSIILLDHLYFNHVDNDVALIFDLRYSFSLPERIFLSKFENIKLLNKELLSEIQVTYSSYCSRLGFTKVF